MQFAAAWPTAKTVSVYAESGGFRVDAVTVCRSFWTRAKGLLGRSSLPPHEGVLLVPCTSVHTVAMKFAIDLVYLDSSGTVLFTVHKLSPQRMHRGPRGTHAVLEVAHGVAATLSAGQRLAWGAA